MVLKNKRELVLLVIILLIGSFVRIFDLGHESLWLDEGFSIMLSKLNLSQFTEKAKIDLHPQLYYLLLHYWIKIFGDSEFSTRFLSVIFGILTIFMIYKVGNLMFNNKVGILSALILALTTFHIRYSQEVRMYSLMALLTLTSFYFFIKLFDKTNFVVSIGYILSSIFLIYTHHLSLLIILSQNIYIFTLFLLSKNNYKLIIKKWILLQTILVVLFIPWIYIKVKQILLMKQVLFLYFAREKTLIHVMFMSLFRTYCGTRLLLLLYSLILFIIIIITYKKNKNRINRKNLLESIKFQGNNLSIVNKIYLLLLWLLIPIILLVILCIFSITVDHHCHRYTIADSLSFYLLIAKGIEELSNNIKNNKSNKYIMLIIISLIIFSSLKEIRKYYILISKEQWREVANYIDTNAKSEDLLLFHALTCQECVFDYYSKRMDLNKKIISIIEKKQKLPIIESAIKELKLAVKSFNRIWFIIYNTCDTELIVQTLSENYKLLYCKKYIGINVYLFEKKML